MYICVQQKYSVHLLVLPFAAAVSTTGHGGGWCGAERRLHSVDAGKPVLPIPAAPMLPAGVKPEVGEPGESCTAACNRTHSVCSAQHFSSLNNCNVLRQHFACEAGCENSTPTDQPAYVIADAPKEQQPTACLVSADDTQYHCDSSIVAVRRLCPCATILDAVQ